MEDEVSFGLRTLPAPVVVEGVCMKDICPDECVDFAKVEASPVKILLKVTLPRKRKGIPDDPDVARLKLLRRKARLKEAAQRFRARKRKIAHVTITHD